MSLTPQEQIQMKVDVEGLKTSTAQVLAAIGKSTEAQEENSKLITELVIEMRERDVRDEYRKKDYDDLKGHMGRIDKTITAYIETHHNSLERLSKNQQARDNFVKSATSAWGKVFAMVFIAAMAYVLGIDLTKVLK